MVRVVTLFALAATATGHQYGGALSNGACDSTSPALSTLCSDSATWGVCHAWTDAHPVDRVAGPLNSDATYRGAWINELVFLQEYRVVTSAADASAMSRIRMTTPALAGLHDCTSDFAVQGALLKDGRDMKHIDVSVSTAWAGIFAGTSLHAEDSAVTKSLPILPATYLGNGAAATASTTGNAWGVQRQGLDAFGLSNSLIVKFQPIVGETLTSYMGANIITKDGTAISAIGLGDEVLRTTQSVKVDPAKVLDSGTVKLTCVTCELSSRCVFRRRQRRSRDSGEMRAQDSRAALISTPPPFFSPPPGDLPLRYALKIPSTFTLDAAHTHIVIAYDVAASSSWNTSTDSVDRIWTYTPGGEKMDFQSATFSAKDETMHSSANSTFTVTFAPTFQYGE